MTLSPPIYIENDPAQNEAELIALFEQSLGKTLYPAQSEALLVYAIAYIQGLTKSQIQHTGEQTLVNYGTSANLDQIGALWGEFGARLPASRSLTTLKFTLASAEVSDRIIGLGTRVRTSDRAHVFRTTQLITILAGNLEGESAAEAEIAGIGANGYPPGEINEPFDLIFNLASVANTSESANGTDAESDDEYRERLKDAPAAFSTGGSRAAYRYFAQSADPSVGPVSVKSPTTDEQNADKLLLAERISQDYLDAIVNTHGGDIGTATAQNLASIVFPELKKRDYFVRVYFLDINGNLPSSELVQKVQSALNNEDIRPICDEVVVSAPYPVNYSVSAEIVMYSDTNAADLQNRLDNALAAQIAEIDTTMDRDIVRSQFISALQIEGVYRVDLTQPSADIPVRYDETPNNISKSVTITNAVSRGN